jgi:diguanylate cyclase
MESTRPAAPRTGVPEAAPAQLAKAALRRLAIDKLEPTPENYDRAYRAEAGAPVASAALPEHAQRLMARLAVRAVEVDAPGAADFHQALAEGRWEQAERALDAVPAGDASGLATLIERIVRGVGRGGRNWTAARKKDSLQRVLTSSRSDAKRLQQRLSQLVGSWESDAADTAVEADDPTLGTDLPPDAPPAVATTLALEPAANDERAAPALALDWPRVVNPLGGTVQQALPACDGTPHELATALAELTAQINEEGATPPLAEALDALCQRAALVLQHRHHLTDQLGDLCRELAQGLADLAEDDSWARGQCEAMQLRIDEGLTARGVRAVAELLRTTRERQNQVRAERARARDALKVSITRMLSELEALGSTTGDFHDSVARYADVIQNADSLESLAGVVSEMVEESRTVQALVRTTQEHLRDEHGKANELTQRVNELELEMRRLSDEVSTDQLTQIANRRGLLQAFDTERARLERSGSTLSIGLLDIDNFKRLNDELGHAAGDEALKALSGAVAKALRPTDLVARYGGEEFVVLLPDTPIGEAQQILSRLQRSLTGGLFMHEQRQVFVTFSAGVTLYAPGERIEEALERADQALYEAKRTGKNRTCMA